MLLRSRFKFVYNAREVCLPLLLPEVLGYNTAWRRLLADRSRYTL
jgi:hypothetical protein